MKETTWTIGNTIPKIKIKYSFKTGETRVYVEWKNCHQESILSSAFSPEFGSETRTDILCQAINKSFRNIAEEDIRRKYKRKKK